MNDEGKGIVKINDKIFYIDHLIPGEQAIVEIFYQQSDYGNGKIIKLKNDSPNRSLAQDHPKLAYGTYTLAHLKENAQDEYKQNRVINLFMKNFPNLKNNQIHKLIVGSRTNYRNKVVLYNGGFRALNPRVILEPLHFDLMDFDFKEYKDHQGDLIIRKLDDTIIGKPGEKKYAHHNTLGKTFSVGLNSFYQVNNEMAELAFKEIIKNIPINSIVFDLFAGAATIGIHVCDQAKEVYSVEINKANIEDAKKNIELNKINNVKIIDQDANQFVLESKVKPDVIILDPARSGLSKASMEAINKSKAKKIIYLSCNINTQARDLTYLTNYHIDYIQPYDFFPQTHHIENLVIMSKIK